MDELAPPSPADAPPRHARAAFQPLASGDYVVREATSLDMEAVFRLRHDVFFRDAHAAEAGALDRDAFDDVADFDAALRDPADPVRLRHEFDSGDHIHPSDAGYTAMAEAVPLAALAER